MRTRSSASHAVEKRIALKRPPLAAGSREAEHERQVAVFDLIEQNSFHPVGAEAGPFEPHLTLARFKHGGLDVSAELEKHAAWAAGACEVEEVLVMSSDLKRDGPEYTVLGRAPL